jgi:hypothetical protein
MGRSSEKFKEILEFREKKSKELKRLISFSEAIALWLSENLTLKIPHSPKNA